MRKLYTLTLVTVLSVGLYLTGCDTTTTADTPLSEQTSEALAVGKGAKIDICHKRDDQGYISINISVSAEPAHRAHGDGQVGDPVPGMPGFIFDENCVPVENCPCWDVADLESITAANNGTFNSCSTGVFQLPDGALIQNDGSTPGVEGGFASSQSGPACFTRDFPPFVLSITAAEADACTRQIVDRCSAIGDPLPLPPVNASKAPSGDLDPSSIWGSN